MNYIETNSKQVYCYQRYQEQKMVHLTRCEQKKEPETGFTEVQLKDRKVFLRPILETAIFCKEDQALIKRKMFRIYRVFKSKDACSWQPLEFDYMNWIDKLRERTVRYNRYERVPGYITYEWLGEDYERLILTNQILWGREIALGEEHEYSASSDEALRDLEDEFWNIEMWEVVFWVNSDLSISIDSREYRDEFINQVCQVVCKKIYDQLIGSALTQLKTLLPGEEIKFDPCVKSLCTGEEWACFYIAIARDLATKGGALIKKYHTWHIRKELNPSRKL